MLYARENGCEKLYADRYGLEFAADRPYVRLHHPDGVKIADLFFLSSVNTAAGKDDTTRIFSWRVEETLNQIVFSMDVLSSVWQKKVYRFRCFPEHFLYEIEVQGSGDICAVNYFGCYSSAQTHWRSGFFWSSQEFTQGFNPEPSCAEKYYFSSQSNSSINLTGVPYPGRDDWFITPHHFVSPSRREKNGSGWVTRPGPV
jgi:hypothetical protein